MDTVVGLIGRPVLAAATGKQIGEVQEVVLNIDQAVICGIILAGEAWFAPARGVAFTDVRRWGRDAVIAAREDIVRKAQDFLHPAQNVYRTSQLIGKPIYTESGLSLGLLADVLFAPKTGEIKEFQISDGLIADLWEGRKQLPWPAAQLISQDKVIVPESMAKFLHTRKE